MDKELREAIDTVGVYLTAVEEGEEPALTRVVRQAYDKTYDAVETLDRDHERARDDIMCLQEEIEEYKAEKADLDPRAYAAELLSEAEGMMLVPNQEIRTLDWLVATLRKIRDWEHIDHREVARL